MCDYISLTKFIEVAETLLAWFGFCLTYNLHGVHLLYGKTVNYEKI